MHTPGIAKEALHQWLVHLTTQRTASRTKIELPKSLTGHKSLKEVLPPTSPFAHHHISAETCNRVDIADYLDVNERDLALEVRNQYLVKYFLTFSIIYRTLFLNYSIISLLVCLNSTEMALNKSSQMKNEQLLLSKTTGFFATKSCESITQLMITNGHNPRTRPDILMLSGEDHDCKGVRDQEPSR